MPESGVLYRECPAPPATGACDVILWVSRLRSAGVGPPQVPVALTCSKGVLPTLSDYRALPTNRRCGGVAVRQNYPVLRSGGASSTAWTGTARREAIANFRRSDLEARGKFVVA